MTSVTKTDEIFQKSAETRIAIKHGRIGAEFTQIVIMRNCLDLSISSKITSWLKATIM